jgi:hypothetical protein
VWRKRRPYNAPGGDPARRPPGAPPSYFLWFPDDGTFGQEESFREEGFWLRGGEQSEVVLQTLAPPTSVRLVVTAGPAGDIVTVRLGRERQRLVLPPLRRREVVFERPAPALGYYGTSLYVLRFGSRYGAPTEIDKRRLGSFVRVVLVDRSLWIGTQRSMVGGAQRGGQRPGPASFQSRGLRPLEHPWVAEDGHQGRPMRCVLFGAARPGLC